MTTPAPTSAAWRWRARRLRGSRIARTTAKTATSTPAAISPYVRLTIGDGSSGYAELTVAACGAPPGPATTKRNAVRASSWPVRRTSISACHVPAYDRIGELVSQLSGELPDWGSTTGWL